MNIGLCFSMQLPLEVPRHWAGFKLGSPVLCWRVAHWGPTTSEARRVEVLPPQKSDTAGWGQQSWVQMHFVLPF